MFILSLFVVFASAPVEKDILAGVNRLRAERGLPVLEWSEPAAEEARTHCRKLLSGPVTSPHAGFDGRVARLRKRLSFREAAENVGLLSLTGKVANVVVKMWSGSPTHRRNLEGPFALTGVGIVQTNGMVCAAQILLGDPPAAPDARISGR